MIWVTNKDGELTYVCPEWHALTGQTEASALGRGWLAAVVPEDRPMVASMFKKALGDQASFTLQFRVRPANGGAVWIASGAEPSRDPCTNDFLGYLGSAVERPDKRLLQASYVIASGEERPAQEIATSSRWQMIVSHLSEARACVDRGQSDQARAQMDEALQLIERHLTHEDTRHSG
ncbi:MAG: PAS domain-containing protein [Methylobacterium mesophilicum]|nr:PAS domain-containing protein [Methylobacterium mesophilicum]